MLRSIPLLLALAGSGAAAALARAPDAAAWQTLPSGLEHRVLSTTEAGWPVEVELVRVPATGFRVRVLARESGSTSASELAAAPSVAAAVTASGQLDGDRGCPYGWLVSDSQELNELEYRYGGVFWVLSGGTPNLDRARMLITKPAGAQQAAQALDWLVLEGLPSPFAPADLDEWLVIAMDAAGRLVIGRATIPLRGRELASVLARGENDGGAALPTVLAPARGRDIQWLVPGAGPNRDEAAALPVPSLLVIETIDATPVTLPRP